MACSQFPLYDTEDYGGDSSQVQVPCTTELAQPWFAETVNSQFMKTKTIEVTAPQFEFLDLRSWHSHGWIPEISLEVWDVRRDGFLKFIESQAATPDLT